MLSDLPILLILIEREHRRLASQIKRLRTHALDAEQLSQLRQTWADTLGYGLFLPPLLEALDHLIEELEQGEYDPDDYDEVIEQVSRYRRVSWKAIRQTFGSPRQYLDRWGKVRPEYRYAFERGYEASGKLSVIEQGLWLRTLLQEQGFPVDAEPASEEQPGMADDPRAIEALLRRCRLLPEIEPETDDLGDSGHDDDESKEPVSSDETGEDHPRHSMSPTGAKPSHGSGVVDLAKYPNRKGKGNQEPSVDG